ncbi:MAG: NPCBM/NEW2 domain-containing protein [Candidatus Sumerlaeota bacterium]|nr:NPCBM/NEW2 domain-containing protein [Candidatus Sumerlaeota bacterium]
MNTETIWLDSLVLETVQTLFGSQHRHRVYARTSVSMGGAEYGRAVCARANGSFHLPVSGDAIRFQSTVGVDDDLKDQKTELTFEVLGDGKLIAAAGPVVNGGKPACLDVLVDGIRVLEFRTRGTGHANHTSHAVWAEARLAVSPDASAGLCVTSLASIQPAAVRPGYGAIRLDAGPDGGPLRVAGRDFAAGVCAAAGSDLLYTFQEGIHDRFECSAGIDDSSVSDGPLVFSILLDGRIRFESIPIRKGQHAQTVSLSVAGCRELRLVIRGDIGAGLWGDWAGAGFFSSSDPAPRIQYGAPGHTVRAGRLELGFTGDGTIATLAVDGAPLFTGGRSLLAGCHSDGAVTVRDLTGGVLEFRKRLTDPVTGHSCFLTESFLPLDDSVRWELMIEGDSPEPWGTSVESELSYCGAGTPGFWTAWSDPDQRADGWRDPLASRPLRDMTLWHGAPYFREDDPQPNFSPFHPEVFCVPMATVFPGDGRTAVSIVLSPEDNILDMSLRTAAAGGVCFARVGNRIARGAPLRFSLDIVAHEPDWRAGIGWMVYRYPRFFEPTNPVAHRIGGCGAYSSHEGEFDADKLRRMGFSVNWKASLDFPYMGMFLPPVDDDQRWPRFNEDHSYADDGDPDPDRVIDKCSLRSLRDYSERMRAQGFHVLSYFNVTEFGQLVRGPDHVTHNPDDPELWKCANDYLFLKLRDGILYWPEGSAQQGLIETWGWAVVTDPAGPDYAAFLLDQVRRHIAGIPGSDGLCIDRMDWLRFRNDRADDGVSWHNGRPVRSLFVSWKRFMEKLGPLMHGAGKVIFVNNHVKRVDLLGEVDGIFGEAEYAGPAANLSAFCGVGKPVIGWISDEEQLQPDPDAFLQRYLHLGIHPMTPFPSNNHSIIPKSAWAEKLFLDYGPLFNALKGRRWVFLPDIIAAPNGAACLNIFETNDGLLISVTFCRETSVPLRLSHAARLFGRLAPAFEAISPGDADWAPVPCETAGDSFLLEPPVRRGCVIIRARRQSAGEQCGNSNGFEMVRNQERHNQ